MDDEKKRLLIWTAGSLVTLAVLATVAWFGRSHYRHFKEHRTQAQAQAFLAKGDYRNALLSARQTLLLNPANAPACQVMATLADRSHNPATVDYLRRAVQTEPTVDNKLLLASAALRYQGPPFPLTQQILDELAATATAQATNLANYQIVAASLALSLRRLDEAEIHFEAAARLDPTNRLYEMNLAIIRLGMTNEAKAVASRAVLENLRTDPKLGSPALRALVTDRLLHRDIAAANGYSIQLLASAQPTMTDRLQALGILRQLKSGEFNTRLKTLQQQAVTNAVAVVEVSAWMQANDFVAEDLQWLTNLPAGLQAQTPVRLALANAWLQKGDWKALRDCTSKGNWEDLDFLRLALVSRSWSELGVSPVAESNWGAAVNEAGSRYSALTTLLDLAQRWQLSREHRDLLVRIFEKFPRERWVQQALEQLRFADGDTAALNQLYARLFCLFPDNAVFKNNLAFTCLLLKTNLPNACRWAAEVYAGATNNPVAASTYAFGLHLQGRTNDGLAVLSRLDRRLLQQPDTALYYGVLLAASGATNAAAPFLKIARTKSQWLPEEKSLLSAAGG